MAKTRPPYPAEFREQIVELARVGRTAAELSREVGCSAQTVTNWIAQAAIDAGKLLPSKGGLTTAERDELARLRRENRRLQAERDILANPLRGAPRPWEEKHPAPTLQSREDSRPLAFWRLTTP